MTDISKDCPQCNSKERIFSLKIIPTNRTDPFWPKYIPQIKEICCNCGSYIRFVPQTQELIENLNSILKELKWRFL